MNRNSPLLFPSSTESRAPDRSRTSRGFCARFAAGVFLAGLAVCLSLPVACKKQQPPSTARDFNGVTLDMAKLDTFTNAPAEVQGHVAMLRRAYRYSQFPQAMMELDQIASNTALTPEQKNVVTEFIEQTRQIITNAPPASGQ